MWAAEAPACGCSLIVAAPVWARIVEGAQVGAGAEGAVARAGEDRDPRVAVSRKRIRAS